MRLDSTVDALVCWVQNPLKFAQVRDLPRWTAAANRGGFGARRTRGRSATKLTKVTKNSPSLVTFVTFVTFVVNPLGSSGMISDLITLDS